MSVFVLQDPVAPDSGRPIDYARELNQEQLDVVLHGDGPCLVLAGAGSGKTRTITYRVAYLLEQGILPAQIALLTFTNKAAREMLDRVALLAGDAAKGVWGGTFHSMANRLLRRYADTLGYTSSFTILDQDDGQSLIKAIMKELRIDPKARRFPTASVVQNILSYARNTLTPVEEVLDLKHPNFADFSGEIEEIGRIFADRKKAANAMDFDDLLVNWVNLLSRPDLGDRISAQFRYVLVDEYQDTNALQALIVGALAKAHQNILVVGDDAQSIYAFRGADVKNILRFPDQWDDARMFKLLTNYRSVPEILDLANDSLSHNTAQFQKDLQAVKPKGQKPTLVPASSARQEAQYIAEQVLGLRAEGVALANMAVLFRSSAHSQALEFELLKRDIPYEYRGGMKFFERAHSKDVIAYIRVAHNPKDEPAWTRVLNLQTGIGGTTAAAIIERIRTADDVPAIDSDRMRSFVPARGEKGWNAFLEVAHNMLAASPAPGRMLRAVIDSSYTDYLEREYPDFKERIEDLEQLALFADAYENVADFLADLALYDEAFTGRERTDGGEEERMVLTTIHQAKGLEWDTVFVIHLADQSFPSKRSLDEPDGLEEERRLFYVAVTRARRRLFLTYPVTAGYDTMYLNQPSLFIEEVSPRLLDRMELRESRGRGDAVAGSRNRTDAADRSDWSWDDSYEEPTIAVDRNGDRGTASTTVWRSAEKNTKRPPASFLRSVDDL